MRTSTGSGALSIALVGTRGVPARYGGFETCVEEVGRRLADRGHRVVVYCRSAGDAERPAEYLGMQLVHRPAMRKRSLETLSHTALSVAHLARHRVDAAVVFNAANAPFLPVLRAARIPVATHVDGLEWKRTKWSGAGQRYYQGVEKLSVRWSDALIADATGIAEYYRNTFGARTELIAYGAPRTAGTSTERLAELDLEAGRYHLVVARFEPENHVLEIVQGYVASDATMPLVVVGSAPYSDAYTAAISAAADPRVRLLGGVWDAELLDQLYVGAHTYLHGHSVGGTNPSLLRAIGAGTATTAFDVNFNREVLGDSGVYFAGPADVAAHLRRAETDTDDVARRSAAALDRASHYDWDDVTDKYEDLCRRLAARRTTRAQVTA
ncbi:DUF1972 domain-containing protein [Nakamurella sp. A5-74]|uniref:DUF1972 domain-containing protein n=1 Tax=Nakamurella sp. A5-74 TaxID=3158264 RepID=A0AAU8DLR6_9ACTN